MRLTIGEPTQHHVTIPKHDAFGTLAGVLDDVAVHLLMTREQLFQRLFG